MAFWTVGLCAVFLVVLGGMLSAAAFGSCRRGLDWPDIAAIGGPPLALLIIAISFLFLAWPLALLLAIGVSVILIWGIGYVVKHAEKGSDPR